MLIRNCAIIANLHFTEASIGGKTEIPNLSLRAKHLHGMHGFSRGDSSRYQEFLMLDRLLAIVHSLQECAIYGHCETLDFEKSFYLTKLSVL